MAGSLVLYGQPVSQPCRSVAWFAAANSIPLEYRLVALRHGEQKTQQYLSLNRAGTVPTLEHRRGDGSRVVIGDSLAALMYLAEKFNCREYWPDGLDARTQIMSYCGAHAQSVRGPTRPFNRDCFFGKVGPRRTALRGSCVVLALSQRSFSVDSSNILSSDWPVCLRNGGTAT